MNGDARPGDVGDHVVAKGDFGGDKSAHIRVVKHANASEIGQRRSAIHADTDEAVLNDESAAVADAHGVSNPRNQSFGDERFGA